MHFSDSAEGAQPWSALCVTWLSVRGVYVEDDRFRVMKVSLFRWQPTLAAMVLILAAVLPAQGARVRRNPAFVTETFRVANDAWVVVGTDHQASLRDLKVGQMVTVGYDQENGVLVAHRLAEGVPHKPRNLGAASAPKPRHPHGAPGLAHVHGVIRSVDVQTGALTITHRLH